MSYICPICLDNIYIFYYKSNNCNCNLRFHYNCIINWYKYNSCCILCKTEDKTNVLKKKNKDYEKILLISTLCVFLMCFIKVYCSYLYL